MVDKSMTASCVESWLHATSGEPSWHLQLPPLDSRRTPPYLTFAKRFAHGAGAEGLVEIIQAGVVGNVIEPPREAHRTLSIIAFVDPFISIRHRETV